MVLFSFRKIRQAKKKPRNLIQHFSVGKRVGLQGSSTIAVLKSDVCWGSVTWVRKAYAKQEMPKMFYFINITDHINENMTANCKSKYCKQYFIYKMQMHHFYKQETTTYAYVLLHIACHMIWNIYSLIYLLIYVFVYIYSYIYGSRYNYSQVLFQTKRKHLWTR